MKLELNKNKNIKETEGNSFALRFIRSIDIEEVMQQDASLDSFGHPEFVRLKTPAKENSNLNYIDC